MASVASVIFEDLLEEALYDAIELQAAIISVLAAPDWHPYLTHCLQDFVSEQRFVCSAF